MHGVLRGELWEPLSYGAGPSGEVKDGFRVLGLGFWGSGFWGLGDLGFRGLGVLGFRVWGFRVQSLNRDPIVRNTQTQL